MTYRGEYRARDPNARRTWWSEVEARETLWQTVFHARKEAAERSLRLVRLRDGFGRDIDMIEVLAR